MNSELSALRRPSILVCALVFLIDGVVAFRRHSAAWTPPSSTFWIVAACNLMLIGLCVGMIRPYLVNFEKVWRWLPAATLYCFFPIFMAVVDGNGAISLLALWMASAVSFYKDRDGLAGVLLGMAAFRPQFAVPVALLFLLWRRWRITAAFAATSALLALTWRQLSGTHRWPDFVLLDAVLTGRSDLGRSSSTQFPNLLGLITWAGERFFSQKVLLPVVIVLSLALLGWAATRTANFALATMVALLVSYRAQAGDLVLLILPLLIVFDARLGVSKG